MKGNLYYITIQEHMFPVLTENEYRALDFYKTVFPDQNIERKNITQVECIYTRETLREKFQEVKKIWAQMCLLQAEPGSIKFNTYALDLLLENNELILTNSR